MRGAQDEAGEASRALSPEVKALDLISRAMGRDWRVLSLERQSRLSPMFAPSLLMQRGLCAPLQARGMDECGIGS